MRDFERPEGGGEGNVKKHERDERESVLARRRMSRQCQEVIDLGDSLAKICLFRDWVFGPDSVMRQSRGADRLGGPQVSPPGMWACDSIAYAAIQASRSNTCRH